MLLSQLRLAIRKIIKESLDKENEETVQELMTFPEYQSVESFVELKLEESEDMLEDLGKKAEQLTQKEKEKIFGFKAEDAHAIVRNIMKRKMQQSKYRDKITTSTDALFKDVKKELESYGLIFIPLEAKKEFRGFTAPKNGSNRFAGNHGGPGVGDGGIGIGNGLGTMGSGKKWDPSAKTSLPMGPRRR